MWETADGSVGRNICVSATASIEGTTTSNRLGRAGAFSKRTVADRVGDRPRACETKCLCVGRSPYREKPLVCSPAA